MTISDPSQAGFHQLYSHHHSWLYQLLRRKLGDAEQAADLAQDTFIRLLNTGQQLEIREPRAYLSTIARGLVADMFRRRSLEQAYLDALQALPEPQAISPEQRMLVLETLVAIDRMLDDLGPRTRDIFLMAQLEGLSYVAIAERLQVSVTTIKKHMIRAMTHCLVVLED
ncbi:sigma-70 family RNA polymerase sigma factor [Methylobacillus arboreus]|uniref:sigma-70 family RNA polymerase sigma factor n=1 Tax=Methylobacillus arboreus TaxID=755170 RepID=UPI001E5A0F97|nr:sigma-70 family RNA polymerase sigma factor [Methylobacillus arboreus]MCB5191003.1 sigma-70 family RNA polymerase sigma factor [Methylobacillus arboreus]